MKKQVLAALGALTLGLAFQVHAAPVGGSMDKIDNGCISPIPFYVGDDCSYNGGAPIVGFGGVPSYIGPIAGGSYHEPLGSAAGLPEKRLRVDGDLTITGVGPGAILSGTFTIAAGEYTVGCTQAAWCNESWTSIDHVITPAAMSAVANSAGGYDYQLTTHGAPAPLQPCIPYPPYNCTGFLGTMGFNFAGQVFPSVTPSQFYVGTAWQFPPQPFGFSTLDHAVTAGPEALPIPSLLPNLGTTTTGTMNGRQCIEGLPDGDCSNGAMMGTYTPVSSPGIENLQARISTNAAGTILNADFSVSQEFDTLAGFGFGMPHPDSFAGNYIALSGIEAVAKPGGSPDVQIDKKNNFVVVIYGSAGFDVNSIDVASLQFGPGLYALPPNGPTLGSEVHQQAHISGGNLTAHFASNASDLQCGNDQVKLRGTSDGVPFVVSVEVNGVGKACRPE